jgi:long-subunit fatty acid transport protein
MKINIKLTSLALCVLFGVSLLPTDSAFAQDEKFSYGSTYSAFGAGLPYDVFAPTTAGSNLFGLTNTSGNSANLTNPAVLGFYQYTSLSGGFSYSEYSAEVDGGSTSYGNFDFKPFAGVFPILKNRLGFSVGMYPKTEMNFRNTYNTIVPGDTTQALNELVGEGGISAFELGFGYRINKNWAIGYTPTILMGSTVRRSTIYIEGSRYITPQISNTISHLGYSQKVGLHFQAFDAFKEDDRFTFGIVAEIPLELTTEGFEKTTILNNNGFQQSDEVELGKSNVTMPWNVKAGVTYHVNQKWSVGTDFLYEPWSEYVSSSGSAINQYKDRWRIGVGSSFYPDLQRTRTYLAGLAYKVGVSYDSGAITVAGNDIDAISVSAGVTLPSQYNRSAVELLFNYERTGTTNNSLIQENIFTFGIVFNVSELMFFRRKLQ